MYHMYFSGASNVAVCDFASLAPCIDGSGASILIHMHGELWWLQQGLNDENSC